MTRILIFGYGPLPGEGLRLTGPGLRTWHFVSVLREAGHEVCLIGDRIAQTYPDDLPPVITRREPGWLYQSVADTIWHSPKSLGPLIADFKPDCVISVTTPAAIIAANNIGPLPLWADLYGSIMAEAQLKALVYGDDALLPYFWNIERRAIERADFFSAVSERQMWSIVGELGLLGRLNQWTSGHELATTIPIASESEPYSMTRRVIRGTLVDDSAFVILYSGGYNTWTDVDTLFAALEQVMSQRPEVVFVSTGGRIEGHDDLTFVRFQRMIEGSPHWERYKLQGWVPSEDVPGYYLESDLAVNVDRMSYEALLGSRTRVLDWLRAGLPFVMSSLTELGEQAAAARAGLTYRAGDVQDLTACLLRCITDPVERQAMGQRGRALLLEKFTYQATSQRLLAWAERPARAPDTDRPVPKLVQPYQNVGTQFLQVIKKRQLNLSLAVTVWPLVVRITNVLRLHGLQRRLAKIGMRALRMERAPYQARYSAVEVPLVMRAGEICEGRVTLTNTMAAIWPAATGPGSFSLSYHWKDESGRLIVRDGLRTPIPSLVEPGQSVTLTFRVAAPDAPGQYVLELDMLREGVTWFSEVGATGVGLPVRVEESGRV